MRKHKPFFFRRIAALFALLLSLATLTQAEIKITLSKEFIEENKNRATVATTFFVDHTKSRPNSPSKDGDLHIAGHTMEIALPVVAEIMNAKEYRGTVKYVNKAEGTDDPITLIGMWRIWCEHGGDSQQNMFKPFPEITNSNPDHVFEIHPVTMIDDFDLTESLHPIDGYETKDAERSFNRYETLRCTITPEDDRATITTIQGGYNYVEFVMEVLDAEPHQLDDGGYSVFASAYTLGEDDIFDGDLLVRKRRMIFAPDTPPAAAIEDADQGELLHVLGIPRMNLAILSWRIEEANVDSSVLSWSFPYEIMIVGIYED
jgi:hypothetical protein